MVTAATAHSQLFRVETNLDFNWEPQISAVDAEKVRAAATGYGLPAPEQIRAMKKRNPVTRIYRFETPVGDYVLRTAPLSYAFLLEAQCQLASDLASPALIKPVQSRLKTFTVQTNDEVWMLYGFESGNILSGHESYEQVFAACVQLLEEMKNSRPRGLFSVFHATKVWKQTTPFLWDKKARLELALYISQETLSLIDEQKKQLENRFLEMKNFKLGQSALTHNDLNHANILVGCDGVKIVDLEDLCYEDPNLALAHCFFKVVRHGVYQGSLTPEKGKTVLQKAMAHAAFRGFLVRDIPSFANFASFRMISEIQNLLARIFIQKDPNKPKDLEKKILNLFELDRLTQAS